jgi:hypothetical protein
MVSESVPWPVSIMRRLETVPAQDAHGFAAVDVGQADIHDHQIDLSRLGGLHALAAVLRRDSFKLLVQRKLLRQRVAQFGIIVDNENLTRIRHQFRPPQPLAPMVILPADIKSIKDIIRDDIFTLLLGLRLDDLSKISCPFSANFFPFSFHETFWSVGTSSKLCRLCSGPI